MRCEKNVQTENYMPECGLKILIRAFVDWIYILYFDFKNTIGNQEFCFLTKIREIRNKNWNAKLFT